MKDSERERIVREAVLKCHDAIQPSALDSHPNEAHIHYAARARLAIRRAFPEYFHA